MDLLTQRIRRPFRRLRPAEARRAVASAVERGQRAALSMGQKFIRAAERAASFRDSLAVAWEGRAAEGADQYADRRRDSSFRRLSKGPAYDLSPEARTRALELSIELYRESPEVHEAVEVHTAFVHGDGIKITVDPKYPRLRALLDEHALANDYGGTDSQRIRQLCLFGLLALPRAIDTVSGVTRLAYLSPLQIADVVRDPENGGIIIGVRWARSAIESGAERLSLCILPKRAIAALSPKAVAMRGEMRGPPLFLECVNQIEDGELGVPDYLSAYDGAYWLNQFHELVLARFEYQNNIVWDVEIKGATDAKLKELKEGDLADPPAPNTVNVHSDRQKWNAVSPNIQAGDIATMSGMCLDRFSRGVVMPPTWLSHPEDSNRATAAEMGAPAVRCLSARQAKIRALKTLVLDDQIEIGVRYGKCEPEALRDRQAYTIEMSPIVEKGDVTGGAAALQATAVSLDILEAAGRITRQTAKRAAAVAVSRTFGIEVDPEEETAVPRLAAPAPGTNAPASETPALTPGEEMAAEDYARRQTPTA